MWFGRLPMSMKTGKKTFTISQIMVTFEGIYTKT